MNYEIERRKPADASYSKIAVINSKAGSILSNQSYQYIDLLSGNTAGLISYRIRQVVDTATASFTAVYIDTLAIISLPCFAESKDKVRLVPNPAFGNTSLIVETDYAVSNMTISVYDLNGRLMQRLYHSKSTGRTVIDLSLQKLAAGKYIIKVNNGNTVIGVTELLKL